ncbi:hypothetical protein FHS60_000987 [Alloprevotella rava]|uniref:Uncharacterized protein n=1 Tax=Alloprevotella rava TaxID=671218 RepID=A0A7W5UVY0_9BACT|nr:hypothetical protein [Alloprevotella rava]
MRVIATLLFYVLQLLFLLFIKLRCAKTEKSSVKYNYPYQHIIVSYHSIKEATHLFYFGAQFAIAVHR